MTLIDERSEAAPVTIRRLPALDPAIREAITHPLAEASTAKNFAFAPRYLALGLDGCGMIDGGLIAQLYWDWMYVEILAVPERLRGKGLGRDLIEQAETIARAEGCRGAWVDTYSFQSPGFYEKLGYRPFGRLPFYPGNEERVFLAKPLDEEAERIMTERGTAL
ncbi:MAG: GNAT family N-acetyltransferase [Fulvimarina manganoxydans]|uniref:GNAT family N-acetyltransferase n=1 Tax=Fulvimarina manganoxydans TaxID=937218 RepID=UPI00235315C8|nr:GNAT family N-acetyltransferase [Fulvimarina manganoxydans]MCK5934724.1 GNAT family N-acetyltransferase [Fulvimarina manganoxydans]